MRNRSGALAVILVTVFIISLARPVGARADGGTPPPDQPTQAATDSGTATTPADTATPVSTDVPAATATDLPTVTATDGSTATATDVPTLAATSEGPAPTESASSPTPTATDATSDQTNVSATLSQAPAGTQLVVVDGSGQTVPLATQKAADIIASGDPIWCPSGVTPGDASCTTIGTYTTLSDLVTFLSTSQPTQNGTIWIEAGPDASASAVTIDGSSLTTWKNYSLTLQGGWSGSADTSVNTATPSTFGVPLTITGWNADVAVDSLGISGATGSGLTISTTGNVAVSNTTVTNTKSGDGTTVNAGGTASLNNVQSSNNDLAGAKVTSAGKTSVSNSTFDHNGYGYTTTTTSGPGSGETTSSYSGAPGLQAASTGGDVSLVFVTADANFGEGADLTAAGDINVTDSEFGGNGQILSYSQTSGGDSSHNTAIVDVQTGPGLSATGSGISLESVVASGNDGSGASLTASASASVSDSQFSGNGFNPDISINDLTTYTLLGGFPETIVNNANSIQYGSGLTIKANGSVTLTNDQAGGNAGNGASLVSLTGEVSITDSSFNGNGGQTSSQDTYNATIFFGTTFNSTQKDFGGTGLQATAYDATSGLVLVQNSIVDGNGYDGAELNGTVLVVDSSIFDGNGYLTYQTNNSSNTSSSTSSVAGSGLVSDTAITTILKNAKADGNAGIGANLNTNGSAELTASIFDGNGFSGIHSTSGSQVDQTGQSGLVLNATGDLGLVQVTADGNAGDGGTLTGNGSISADTSTFMSNGYSAGYKHNNSANQTLTGDGLNILGGPSSSTFLLGVTAGDNAGAGASVVDSVGGDVAVTSSTFNANGQAPATETNLFFSSTFYGDGLDAGTSNGNVSLVSVTANDNLGYGATLGSLSLNDLVVTDSTFNRNGAGNQFTTFMGNFNGSGLQTFAGGNVILTNVTADHNTANGADVNTSGGNLDVNSGAYTCNDQYGIKVESGAATVNLNGPDLSGNGFGPIDLLGGTLGTSIFTDTPCGGFPPGPGLPKFHFPPTEEIPVTGDQPFELDCTDYVQILLQLKDGDQATYICPVHSKASLQEFTRDTLPAPLPGGDGFVSGHTTLLTTDSGTPEKVITSGGALVLSLDVPKAEAHKTIAILFWDPSLKDGAGDWFELPAYAVDQHGNPVISFLHKDAPQDQMLILKGVRLMEDGRVEVTVNFPGTFVLVTK